MSAKEIRIHGRGGQGAVLAAKMLASACAYEGQHVASFPMYGFERRGMPVIAFTRFDTKPIREKTRMVIPTILAHREMREIAFSLWKVVSSVSFDILDPL